ncbi:MAG: host attachment protein [Legionellales bacterium]|nr:host attachment protein [Legionellales bacterium]
MKNKLIILANATTVKIFSDKGNCHLELIKELDHPENRLKISELLSDRPGHYKTRGDSHGAYSMRTSIKDTEKNRFAIKVAETMEESMRLMGCSTLILISEPKFYSFLKKHMTKPVEQSIDRVIKINPGGLEVRDLQNFILEHRYAA